jgi:hypothetical protein
MKHAVVLTLVAAASLAACATRDNYEQGLNGWVGHSRSELAASWGRPTSVYSLAGGGSILTYQNVRTKLVPTGTLVTPATTTYIKSPPVGGGPGYSYGASTGYVVAVPPAKVTLECVTTFKTDHSGKITGWTTDGNDCEA